MPPGHARSAENRTPTCQLAVFSAAGHGGTLPGVFSNKTEAIALTAAEARDHLSELESERALASMTGIAEIDVYMRDLEVEIDTWRRLYVISAVTEIATLRAELFEAELG